MVLLSNLIILLGFLCTGCVCMSFTDVGPTGSGTVINFDGMDTFVWTTKGISGPNGCYGPGIDFFFDSTWRVFKMYLAVNNGTMSSLITRHSANDTSQTSSSVLTSRDPGLNLTCDYPKGFWFSWNGYDGYVTAGTGIVPGMNVLWNISAPNAIKSNLTSVFLDGGAEYEVAEPFSRYPSIESNQQQWTLHERFYLTDADSTTCVKAAQSTDVMKIKFVSIFPNENEKNFNVVVKGKNLDCIEVNNVQVYSQIKNGGGHCIGVFEICKLSSSTVEGGFDKCVYQCQCRCEDLFIQVYGGSAEICDVFYP